MENEIVFQCCDGAFWLSIVFAAIGLLVIGGVIWFGQRVFGTSNDEAYLNKNIGNLLTQIIEHRSFNGWSTLLNNAVTEMYDSYSERINRRNEYWSIYGQTVLAILIVIVLAILMVTKTISAEAGLPILSAVSGFAIAKSVSSGSNRGSNNPPTNRNEQPNNDDNKPIENGPISNSSK